MNYISKALYSRTFWTLVAAFVIGGVQAIQPFMPGELFAVINTVLLAAAAYFKLKPSQKY